MKQVGALIIDEENKRFRIDTSKEMKKSGLASKMVKGTLALGTAGLSLAAEAATKKGLSLVKNDWIPFAALVDYHVVADNARETYGGSKGVKIMKGVYVGGTKKSSKMVTQSMEIRLQLDSLERPSAVIPIMGTSLAGSAFEKAMKLRDDTISALDYIMKHR